MSIWPSRSTSKNSYRWCGSGCRDKMTAASKPTTRTPAKPAAKTPERIEDIEMRLLLEAIFQRYHYDFRGYAMASIKRRLHQARERFNCRSFSMLQDLG